MSYKNYLKWQARIEDFEHNWEGTLKSYCQAHGLNYIYFIQQRKRIREGQIDPPDKVYRRKRGKGTQKSRYPEPLPKDKNHPFLLVSLEDF